VLIGCTLCVIALICGLHVRAQLAARGDQNRAQGVSLVGVLSSISHERLVPQPGQQGPLDVVKTSQSNSDFAYTAIADADGRILTQVTAPGVILPVAAIPQEPSEWVGERVLKTSDGRPVREFLSPVIEDGQRTAHVRVGFLEPDLAIFLEQVSLLGMMALPIFLLTPLAYFMLRRGVRPLVAACGELEDLVRGQRFDTVQIEASGEVGEFIRGFNRFMSLAKSRIGELEQEKNGIVASSKVVAYQKARIEAVLGSLSDATLILDETGSVVFANARLETILGISPEIALGRKAEEWCTHPEIVSALARCRGRAAQPMQSHEIELSTGAATPTSIRLTTRPLANREGSDAFVGTLVVLHDGTASALARRAQGEFMAHVAHEIKAPLNVVSMYGESLLGEQAGSLDYRTEASNVINDEVERLATLVNTLLSIARIESGAVAIDRQRVRLQDFLEDAVTAVSRTAHTKSLQFLVDVPKDVNPIYVEKELFRVAINNLLTNAIKYNRDRGEVTVSVEEVGGQLCIRVRDTGIGISETDLPHIFDKFYRSDDAEIQKRSGHGLGLSLAREIVGLHGGVIEVESAPGEGTEFSIVLRTRAPRASEDSDK
jgi:signal transduction histidine kinase